MPNVKQKIVATPPPIDWLWAAILERKVQYGWDLKTMATVAGVSYGVMRNLWRKSPWEWPKAVRARVCEAFNLRVDITSNSVKIRETPVWANIS